jgi:hypothetical protein
MNNNSLFHSDYTNKDYASLRAAMLALARERLPEWTDHSPNDLGVVLVELFAYMGDLILHYQDHIANESYLDSARERRSLVNLLRLIGYELSPPQPASADLILLFAEEATGAVTIDTDTQFQTTAQATGTPVSFRYVRNVPLSIELGKLPIITHRDGNPYRAYQPLPVVQVDAVIRDEVLGSSDASAQQRFSLAHQPLIADSLIVSVDEGAGPRAWARQASLLHSGPGDFHYAVRRDENDVAWVEFGDNKYGRVPNRGRNNITASYRTGGGNQGNVPPNTITKAVTAIADLEQVFNERAANGGADAEDADIAARRGPQLFRARQRAVTAQDYEIHARAFGVAKARARAPGWNRVELFVAPAGGGQPSDTLKEDLREYFEDKRILTTLLDIRDPSYTEVYIEGTLHVEAYYFTDQVRQQVENAVSELLAFDNVDFEDKLYLSKVYEAIEAVKGVAGVHIARFARSDSPRPLPEEGILRFGWDEIPRAGYATGIRLTAVRGGNRGR